MDVTGIDSSAGKILPHPPIETLLYCKLISSERSVFRGLGHSALDNSGKYRLNCVNLILVYCLSG